MWLNCKVIKKVATLTFLHHPPPPFQVYPPFLAKNFESPQVTQFLEGPTPLPPRAPFNKGALGGPTMLLVSLHILFRNKQVNFNHLTFWFLGTLFWIPIPVNRYEIRSEYSPAKDNTNKLYTLVVWLCYKLIK